MACCCDVRSVIFYWEFDPTIQHKQNLLVGLLAYIVAISTALAGDRLLHYFLALFLAGFEWNFLYIGGGALVASVATAKQKGRVRVVADLTTTSLVALASLSAGGLHSHSGRNIRILAGCVPVVILLAV